MIADNQSTVSTKQSVEAVNIPLPIVEFRDRRVASSDMATMSLTVTHVSFISCRSKEWLGIGQRLTTLPRLKTLSVEHCDCEDSLCESICGSESLVSVRMGKLCVTQKTAASQTKESNNYLTFSSSLNCVSAAPRKRLTATTTLSPSMGSKQCS
jgi:hypothetical protein